MPRGQAKKQHGSEIETFDGKIGENEAILGAKGQCLNKWNHIHRIILWSTEKNACLCDHG